jgi:EmrB/QacA subfamily drug resistance transporter
MDLSARAYERRWLILIVLCFSLLVIVLDNTILNVALPRIQKDLSATQSQLEWMVDSYTLVFACLLLSAGSLGDRFGRRGGLQIGLAIFGLGSLLSAFANSPSHLIATRALMGVGGAFIMPATLSILTNVFPPAERGRAIGVWAGVSGIGIALGPLTGGFLIEHFYWGSIFLVNVPIVIVALVAGYFLIPSSKDPSAPKLDFIGAGLSIVALTSLLYGLIQAPGQGWGSPVILTAFGVAVVLLVAFAWWELRSTHPMLDVSFFTNPRFTAASAGITLIFFGMFGVTFLLTQYFQSVLGYSPFEAGLRFLPWAITIMVTAPLSARLVQRIGTKMVVGTGLSLAALSFLLLSGLSTHTAYLDIVWRMLILGVGMGLTMAPATDSIMGSLPLAKAGVGSAVNDTTRQVGGALGVAVIGSILTSIYGSNIATFLRGKPIPAAAAAEIKNGLVNALGVAADPHAAAYKVQLIAASKTAFVDGLTTAVYVAAAATIVGAIVAFKWLPARARDEDVLEQDAEIVSEIGPEAVPVVAGWTEIDANARI